MRPEVTSGEERDVAGAGPLTASGRRHPFLRAQLMGWPVLGLVYYLAVAPFEGLLSWPLFGFKMVWSITGMIVSTGLAFLYRAARLPDRTLPVVVVTATLASTTAALAWVLALGGMALLMNGRTDMMFTASSFPFVASNHVFILLAWSGAYLTLVFWHRSQEQARKALAAAALARDAQLRMLRYQLEPHFLFNALASVRALIAENPARARETITRLSEFLRYTLGRDNPGGSTVTDEIDVIRAYLEIEKVRFEERLGVDIEMDPAAANLRVPGFLLHPLVENAIKHGAVERGRLQIHIRASLDAGRLTLEVTNGGVLGDSTTPRTDRMAEGGIGVRNVRERLAAAFPDRHTFTLSEDAGRVRARITIEVSADV